MPHVEICGPVSLARFHACFAPRTLREGATVTRAGESFLARDGRSLLLEMNVVEGFLRQSFFLIGTEREDGVMVRLLPRTAPEKTPGVKRAVAWVAAWLAATVPTSTIGATNLGEWLALPLPVDAIPPP